MTSKKERWRATMQTCYEEQCWATPPLPCLLMIFNMVCSFVDYSHVIFDKNKRSKRHVWVNSNWLRIRLLFYSFLTRSSYFSEYFFFFFRRQFNSKFCLHSQMLNKMGLVSVAHLSLVVGCLQHWWSQSKENNLMMRT